MRGLALAAAVWLSALGAQADSASDQLFNAMGIPGLIAAFAEDGRETIGDINSGFLGGQGGDVFTETAQRLYDPARMEAELRASFRQLVDPADARQAVVFFDSAQGQRIVALEVQARQAMVDDALEDAAKAASTDAGDDVLRLISVRDLVEVNTDIAMAARTAFYDGFLAAAPSTDAPDIEGQRGTVAEDTRTWITGYYMLVASAMEDDDLDTYTAFWETDVAQRVDAALSDAFEQSYVSLSYGMGQIVGRLMPQNDL
ncbi:MAG: DUF2059 domain-containing protein [Pseudomonadota bacterium]